MTAIAKPNRLRNVDIPTVTELRKLLSYNPNTGEFYWLVRRGYRAPAGASAGFLTSLGYKHIKIMGRTYAAHRIAWLLVYGRMPADQLDHINGDRSDNRISNLRECTRLENYENKATYKSNTSGFTGVSWHHSNQAWVARITKAGRRICLGYYKDIMSAANAYAEAKAKLHTFCPIQRAAGLRGN